MAAELTMNGLMLTADCPPSKQGKPGKNDEQVGGWGGEEPRQSGAGRWAVQQLWKPQE